MRLTMLQKITSICMSVLLCCAFIPICTQPAYAETEQASKEAASSTYNENPLSTDQPNQTLDASEAEVADIIKELEESDSSDETVEITGYETNQEIKEELEDLSGFELAHLTLNCTLLPDGSKQYSITVASQAVSQKVVKTTQTQSSLNTTLRSGWEKLAAVISVASVPQSITVDNWDSVYMDALCDNPDCFNVTSSIGATMSTSGTISAYKPRYLTTDATKYAQMKADFDAAVASALESIEGYTDPLQKAYILHNWLCAYAEYDKEFADNPSTPEEWMSFTAYGCMVKMTGVCQSYTMSYGALLKEAGIESAQLLVSCMGHAWNIVKIDGNWYNVDTTWDDQPHWPHGMSWNYFLKSDTAFENPGSGESHHGWTDPGTNGWSTSLAATSTTYDSYNWNTYTIPGYTFPEIRTPLDEDWILVEEDTFSYTGEAVLPVVSVYKGSTPLEEETDYLVYPKDGNINAGNHVLIVKGIGRYEGTVEVPFTITPILFSENPQLSNPIFTYTGSVIHPNPTVKGVTGTLQLNRDYRITYPNDCKNVGTYTMQVEGINNYNDYSSVTFFITAATIPSNALTLSQTTIAYDGKVKSPTPTVKVNGRTLTQNVDYTVRYEGARIAPGTYNVTIEGKGNYTGQASATFSIYKATTPTPSNPSTTPTTSLTSNCAQLSTSSFTFTGAKQKPSIVVKMAGKTLVEGKDYTLSYLSDCVLSGIHTVAITGKGSYKGTIVKQFSILPKKPAIKKLTKAKKAFKINIAAQPAGSISGYEVRYRIKGKSWSTKTFATTSALSKKISKLKSKKTYQVSVRAFKSVASGKLCSAWSATKTVKTT